ncbi:sensor domain-containing diguanylate cyclase [Nocardia jinanensis]|uniref:Diguanylate cyclase n=1 Tax=Nocardia jinanensis TaxID=382504 RepID=A0A917RMC7_9NOCA|nr:sensor domain-containing diguanylate cyclase [Nocardia jinanensis]GGL15269.1 hypothetical protein GCM10011588_32290 [Nocardia jinanensis]
MEELLRSDVVSRWWQALSSTGEVALSSSRVREVLGDLVEVLAAGLTADPFDAAVGVRVGERVAALGFVDPRVPIVSAEVLYELAGRGLPGPVPAVACRRITALLVAVGLGHQRWAGSGRPSPPGRGESAEFRATAAVGGDRFRIVFDNLAVAIAIGDTEGTLIEVNQCLADMVGVRIEEMRGLSIYRFAHPDDVDEIRIRLFDKLVPAREGTVRMERRIVRADGSAVWVAFSITYVKGTRGRPDYLLAVGEDVTERHRLQEKLHWQARHDQLTGLSNRRHLLEQIENLSARPDGSGRVGLCFVDLDRFKEINDRYGHGVGDRVLCIAAARMRDSLATEDYTIARIGGDEFVVLVSSSADDDSVAAVARTLVTALADPISVGEHQLRVSASIGAVVTVVAGVQAEELLDAADRELYRAKAGGKDQWALQVLDTSPAADAEAGRAQGPSRP